jgi:hypothetical protein
MNELLLIQPNALILILVSFTTAALLRFYLITRSRSSSSSPPSSIAAFFQPYLIHPVALILVILCTAGLLEAYLIHPVAFILVIVIGEAGRKAGLSPVRVAPQVWNPGHCPGMVTPVLLV